MAMADTGWALVATGVVGVLTVLVVVLLPTGWQKTQARVTGVSPRGTQTDAEVVYTFGPSRMRGNLTFPDYVYVGDFAIIEFDPYRPDTIRLASWWSRANVLSCWLPVLWAVIITGAALIRCAPTRPPPA